MAEIEEGVALRVVQEQWLAAATREDLLHLIPMAGALVLRHPELALEINASFEWVEQTLVAV